MSKKAEIIPKYGVRLTDGPITTKDLSQAYETGIAVAHMDIGMKALCLATAIREAQKQNSVAQYVLMEVLVDMLKDQTGSNKGSI